MTVVLPDVEALAFFRTFGYWLPDSEATRDAMASLHAESESALIDAFGPDPRHPPILPMMSASTPVSRDWLADDRLLVWPEALLGGAPIVKPPKVTRFARAVSWHLDSYMPIAGVKWCVYFGDPGETISFDVVPGSHRAPVSDYLSQLFDASRRVATGRREPRRVLPPRVPFQRLTLEPYQPLLFDLALWHANLSEQSRLQWAVTFLAPPKDTHETDLLVTHLGEFFEHDELEYDKHRYPYFPRSWIEGTATDPLARALDESGVRSRFVACYGAAR